MEKRISFKTRLAQIMNLLSSKNIKEIHYLEIAVELNISPAMAIQLAKMVAIKHPSIWKYENGFLMRVEEQKEQ